MNFKIDKKEFLKGLSLIQSIAGRKTTLPILTHILLEWDKQSVFLTGTDLETGIREELIASSDQNGKASVSAKKLYEIVRELPDQTIHIHKKENHWITIQCGKSIFNLAGMDPDEFPSLPTFQEKNFSKLPIQLLREMIEKTVFAASNEESRYHLNGVLFIQIRQGEREFLRLVATDGHRLSMVEGESPNIRGIEKGVILPKKGVLELRKMMGDRESHEEIEIYFNTTHGFFKLGKSLMVIRLIEGEFPEYEEVIPKMNDKRLILERDNILSCLKRISTMTTEKGEGVKLSINKNLLEVTSFHQDYGDAKEEVDILYNETPFQIGFNVRYLMEALHSMDTQEVLMELKDEGSPGMIKPSTFTTVTNQLCIIMPMRI